MLLNFRQSSNFNQQEIEVGTDKLVIEFYNELSGIIHKRGDDLEGYTIVTLELDNEDRPIKNTVKPIKGETLIFSSRVDAILYYGDKAVCKILATPMVKFEVI